MPRSFALIGWPLTFSLSPAMHRAAFRAAGIDADYGLRPTPAADLAGVVDDLRAGRLAGANVTVPHKVEIRRWLDDESDLATAIGAVNTIVRTPGGLRGENTDVEGFHRALAALGPLPAGSDAVVLGAGGAARAVAQALLEAGFGVRILSRRTGQGGTLAAGLYRAHPGARLASGRLTPEAIVDAAQGAALLVDATGASAGGAGCLWPATVPVPPHLAIIDLIAWPLETPLVRLARAAGARAIGGLDMLVGQAAASFRLWAGFDPPPGVMRAAALDAARRASAAPIPGG